MTTDSLTVHKRKQIYEGYEEYTCMQSSKLPCFYISLYFIFLNKIYTRTSLGPLRPQTRQRVHLKRIRVEAHKYLLSLHNAEYMFGINFSPHCHTRNFDQW